MPRASVLQALGEPWNVIDRIHRESKLPAIVATNGEASIKVLNGCAGYLEDFELLVRQDFVDLVHFFPRTCLGLAAIKVREAVVKHRYSMGGEAFHPPQQGDSSQRRYDHQTTRHGVLADPIRSVERLALLPLRENDGK